jgi:CMP-N,N'-diacetyllegionaminic acid synthase
MIGARRVLALIPARGGSKGLPRKNLLTVHGRPLLAFTVDAARDSTFIDRVVVSSDDDAIIAAALTCGGEAPFRRPIDLASDTAASIDVALHALDQLPDYEVLVLLQPTSPARTAADIDAACTLFASSGAPSCVSVSAVEQSPYWMFRLDPGGVLRPLIESPRIARRQDLPLVYALNGAIYVADVAWLRRTGTFVTSETVGYVMPASRYGLPLDVGFCKQCVISNQRPNSAVEYAHTRTARKRRSTSTSDGVCDACRLAEQKHATIDWAERERLLRSCATATAATTERTTAWCRAPAARTASTPRTCSSTSTACTR